MSWFIKSIIFLSITSWFQIRFVEKQQSAEQPRKEAILVVANLPFCLQLSPPVSLSCEFIPQTFVFFFQRFQSLAQLFDNTGRDHTTVYGR